MWSCSTNTELQCCQTQQLTSEAEWKWVGRKKRRKKGFISSKAFVIASVVSQCALRFTEQWTDQKYWGTSRAIFTNGEELRMFACHRGNTTVGRQKICIANDVLEMVKVEELQQRKHEKWESRSDCVLPSLLLYIKLPGEDTICYHNMYGLLMCPMKTPVVGTDTSL